MTPEVLCYDRGGHTQVFTVSSRTIISRMDPGENGLAVHLWSPLRAPRSTNKPSTAGSITVYRKTTCPRGLVWCKKGLVRSGTKVSSLTVLQDDHIPFHAALIWTHSATHRPWSAILQKLRRVLPRKNLNLHQISDLQGNISAEDRFLI